MFLLTDFPFPLFSRTGGIQKAEEPTATLASFRRRVFLRHPKYVFICSSLRPVVLLGEFLLSPLYPMPRTPAPLFFRCIHSE